MICCAVVVVVLIVLGVIAYVYIPRYPQIKVYSINLSNFGSTNTPYSFTVADSSNPDYNTLRFRMNLTMNLGTYNPNPYDFDVTEIDLSALMMVNKSVITNALLTTPLSSFSTLVDLIPPPANHTTACTNPSYSPQIGTASHGAVVFPAKQTVNYTMLFLLDYSPDPNCGLLYDPTINEIASACGITSRDESQRPMDIRYNAQSTISSLQSLGFTPTISGDIHINCPFSNTSIKAVVADVESGMSIMAAIESVFGGSSASSSVTLTDGGSSGSSSSSGGSSSGSTTSISSGGNNSGDAVTTTAQANGDSNGGATTTTTATDNGGAVDTALASTVQTVASDGAGNGAATSTIADVGGGGATSTTNIIGVQPTSATTDAAAGAGV
ncbi:hypothetical protein HDU82_001247 [Entophlyctis luteolus]|nr:hypothetical protein HDU82_001247 [Entophlyctis luteolus]